MSNNDLDILNLSNEIAKMEAELVKATYWIDRFKAMSNECLIRKRMLDQNIEHLKKNGVISSMNEFGKIKDSLAKTIIQLGNIDGDLKAVVDATDRIKKRLTATKEQYSRLAQLDSIRGVILEFRRK